MTHENYRNLFERYHSYLESLHFLSEQIQENIFLKQVHTDRVIKNARELACYLNVSEEDLYIAQAAALLHDIGRFKQYITYQTFNDKISVNHAVLGIQEINSQSLLEAIPSEAKSVILRTIEVHNVLTLPEDLNSRTLLHAQILRDADKLDILRVVTSHYRSSGKLSNKSIELDLPDTPEISNTVLNAVKSGALVNNRDVKTLNDFKLLQISWIFDLNFSWTKQQVLLKEYVKEIFEHLPKTESMSDLYVFSMSALRSVDVHSEDVFMSK